MNWWVATHPTESGESMALDDDMISDQIRCEMRELRKDLRGSIESVATQARQLTDWKYYVQQTPWLAVGLAALAGFSVVPGKQQSVAAGTPTNPEKCGDAGADRAGSVKKTQAGGDGLTGFAKRLIVTGLTRSAMNFLAGKVAEIVDTSARTDRPMTDYTVKNERNMS